MITQLSLWEAPVQDMQVPGVPHLVYLEHSWADGDTRPDQLVRLSHVILGDLAMFDRSDGGPKEVYRIVSTGVVDGKVVAAYEHLCNVKEFYGGSSSSQDSYEDEEEEYL